MKIKQSEIIKTINKYGDRLPEEIFIEVSDMGTIKKDAVPLQRFGFSKIHFRESFVDNKTIAGIFK